MQDGLGFLINLSVSLTLALVLGLVAHRLRLSPVIGYLLAGIALGPHTPGFVADPKMAHDFAEVGVILLLFGVGLHCNFNDLLAVKRVAILGFSGQVLVASAFGAMIAILSGQNATAGILLGISISVASTVVVIRVLTDNELLQTSQGYITIGWLILQDIFTVFVLIALPGIATISGQYEAAGTDSLITLALVITKFAGLALLVVIVGRKAIPSILLFVAHTRSRELFILTILSLALAVATGSAFLCGVSLGLGAFVAGIIVGQTEMSHQAAADALPMRDAFAVLFFVSVGMLFEPKPIIEQPLLFVGLFGIIMLVTPITAFFIVWLLRYPVRTAITVALALTQIGEFSFLVADEGVSLGLLSADGRSILISCALISIAINPPLFRAIPALERWLRTREPAWRFLSSRSISKKLVTGREGQTGLSESGQKSTTMPSAVIVGYGPVGQTACRILRHFGIPLLIIDLNLDTIKNLVKSGHVAIYGDATQREVLKAAGVQKSNYLLVTIPDILSRTVIIVTARELNPDIQVFTRARYVKERAWLEEMGATKICIEEAETAIGCAMQILREIGADANQIQREVREIYRELGMLSDTRDFKIRDYL